MSPYSTKRRGDLCFRDGTAIPERKFPRGSVGTALLGARVHPHAARARFRSQCSVLRIGLRPRRTDESGRNASAARRNMTDGCAKALGPQARADPSPLSRLTDSTPGPSSKGTASSDGFWRLALARRANLVLRWAGTAPVGSPPAPARRPDLDDAWQADSASATPHARTLWTGCERRGHGNRQEGPVV